MALSRYEITVRYRQNHPEWVKANRKDRYKKNAEKEKERSRQYSIEHRDEILEKKRKNYIENSEYYINKQNEYRQNNPEKQREINHRRQEKHREKRNAQQRFRDWKKKFPAIIILMILQEYYILEGILERAIIITSVKDITHENLEKIIKQFKKNGGIIQKLPDEVYIKRNRIPVDTGYEPIFGYNVE